MPGELIPIVLFMVLGVVGVSFSPLARALARRVGGGADAELEQEVHALRDEVEQLRAELDTVRGRMGEMDELQGRVDFAERMLAQVRQKGALPGSA